MEHDAYRHDESLVRLAMREAADHGVILVS